MITITNKMLVENAIKAAREGWLARASGIGAYEYISDLTVDGPNGPTPCRCAIGASLPPDALERLRTNPPVRRIGFLSMADNARKVSRVPWAEYGVQFEDIAFAGALQYAHDRFGPPGRAPGVVAGYRPGVLAALEELFGANRTEIVPCLERLLREIETA